MTATNWDLIAGALVVALFALLCALAIVWLAFVALSSIYAGFSAAAREIERVTERAQASAQARARRRQDDAAVLPAPAPRGRGDEVSVPDDGRDA